jgi:hypothetical protein
MSKNAQTGTLVVYATALSKVEGTVSAVTESGVTIHAREYGRQTKTERFYSWKQIAAATDEGEGFVVVKVDQPVINYNGTIEHGKSGEVSVITEGGRTITVGEHPDMRFEIIYDDEKGPTTTIGKDGSRQSARLDRLTEKHAPAAKKTKTKEKGNRR